MSKKYDFQDLTAAVREKMAAEAESDIADGVLYPSKDFTEAGATAYPDTLLNAICEHDEWWLAQQIAGSFRSTDAQGKKMRKDKHFLFAGSEFNRFYIRGVCLAASERGDAEVEVYRARPSSNPRSTSEAMIGQRHDPALILHDLRAHIGTTPKLNLPLIFSGLSVRLLDR